MKGQQTGPDPGCFPSPEEENRRESGGERGGDSLYKLSKFVTPKSECKQSKHASDPFLSFPFVPSTSTFSGAQSKWTRLIQYVKEIINIVN